MSAVPVTNASRSPVEIPAAIAKREPDAVFAWSSARRLEIIKGSKPTSLSADDLRRMVRFLEENRIREQLS